ncbi:MAG: alanine:cation symporter family protein [Muribaculaceae bacterium]|nr:alanine:cation symporter family protein [Muribaculaceae bacterium]HAP50085.1 sodium/alanine symporter [Porphyromonadaceae bacterium]
MQEFLNKISQWIIDASDVICGYPEFVLLVGGGLFLFFYSGAVSLRRLPWSIRALRHKQATESGKQSGQISSIQALLSAIASTVGMGNIAGVAIALTIGGPGVIFWMWVSAIVGMSTKFFEAALSIMYKGRDSNGEVQGGPMYMIMEGLGRKWRPLAVAFSIFGLIGTLCFMQANQLVESFTTVLQLPDTVTVRTVMGVSIAALVSVVVLGGITRIAKWASRIVPVMVAIYFVLVVVIMVMNYDLLPGVFSSIFEGAFSMEAGFGAFAFVALTGARRAAFVNEAGIGTASMMHGASKNNDPIREGLIAMIAPAIDSGFICTLTSIPIIMAGNYAGLTNVKGLYVALGAYDQLLPGIGQYLLLIIVFCFAFSTMFSYSYYGQKCTNFLFGAGKERYYSYYYLIMLVVGAVIPLHTLVGIMDIVFALMACCTMFTILRLAPQVKARMKTYFN